MRSWCPERFSPVVRFFLTLGWMMLLLLLVDSAMNDPDVKPLVEHQFQRAGDTVLSVLGWFQSEDASSSGRTVPGKIAVPSSHGWPHDSPASNWYWSTMLATAVVILRAAQYSQAITFRVRPVTAPVSRNQGVRLAGRQA
jgi:hypothetical protein